jgi:hypothetical protein
MLSVHTKTKYNPRSKKKQSDMLNNTMSLGRNLFGLLHARHAELTRYACMCLLSFLFLAPALLGEDSKAVLDQQMETLTLDLISRGAEDLQRSKAPPGVRRMLFQEWYRARTALKGNGQDAFPWLFSAQIIDPVPKDGKPVLLLKWLSKAAEIPNIRLVTRSGKPIAQVPRAPKDYWPKVEEGQHFTNHYIRKIFVPLEEQETESGEIKGSIRIDSGVKALTGAVMQTRECRQYVPIVKLHEMGRGDN